MNEWNRLKPIIQSDAKRWIDHNPTRWDLLRLRWTRPGFICLRRYRIVHHHKICNHKIRYLFAYWLWGRASVKFGVSIAPDVTIGEGLMIIHYGGIFINGNTVLGNNVTIYNGVMLGISEGESHPGFPEIGDETIIYPGVKIFGGIIIGPRAKILANSVVINNIPEGSLVSGVPGKQLPRKVK